MIELFIAVAAIILFWIGMKFGMNSAGGLFSEYKNQSWFGILSLATGIVSGFIPSALFAGTCLCIQALLKKRKKNNQ